MYYGEFYYAIIDVIALLTESTAPQQYWRETKRRMAEEMSAEDWIQTQEEILPLNKEVADGKQRLTVQEPASAAACARRGIAPAACRLGRVL